MEDITAEEQLELDQAEKFSADIKWLMGNDQFKRVILDRYIKGTAFDVGVAFTGSDDDIARLTSVTNLTNFLAVNS